MIEYIIHYTGSNNNVGNVAAGAGSTKADITGLTDGKTYNISVEATSLQLSGESEKMTIILGRITLLNISDVPSSHSATSSHSRRCDGCSRVYLSHSVLGGSG